jgi:hypothetical protein
LDVMTPSTRWLMWKLDLAVLSVLVIFILPLAFFYSLLRCGLSHLPSAPFLRTMRVVGVVGCV